MSDPLPERLQADLLVARKARDDAAVTALRTTLAALANAEAPPAPMPASSAALPVSGLVEHERLDLAATDHQRILGEQIALLAEAADDYDALGQADAAKQARTQLEVLHRYTP